MLNLRDTIGKLYADKNGDELIKLLEENHFFEVFKKVEIQLNELIFNQEALLKKNGCVPIGSLVANLLFSINTKIKIIGETKRIQFEQLISDLSVKIIEIIASEFSNKKHHLFSQIVFAIEKTCEFQGYDKSQLLQYLKLENLIAYYTSLEQGEEIKVFELVPALIWKGKTTQLNHFIDIFIDQKLTKRKSLVQKLFDQPNKKLNIIFDHSKCELILHLFSNLKSQKMISTKNCKSIYDALGFHVLDFEKIFLKNKPPKVRMNTLKNSKSKWSDNQKTIEKWLTSMTV